MTNDEKYKAIAQLNAYWKDRYPDAFLTYPDGRDVAREDLLDYFQDLALRTNSRGIKNLTDHLVRLAQDVDALKHAPKPVVVPVDLPKQASMAPIIVFAALWPLLLALAYWGIGYVQL